MGKHKENNPLQEWIDTDHELADLLTEIEAMADSEYEQAQIAFHKLAEKYQLPKYPDDVEEQEMRQFADFHLYCPESMYEVLGKIRFADPNPHNIKSNVLLAAYFMKNGLEPFIEEELDLYLGDDTLAGFGYKGEDIDVEMVPVKKGESWFDKGCTYFIKEV